ncbi:hypothetical protein D3OALGA1CA_3073 [Olavius algarvensis associated proteobacterium Delta 3]|nr:hypothetical protein D3OALGA1CA_3073 [Olavius algarvensis associated proteobacterium Delta 3]CAB5158206.1 hypothetical protein D3OALGB2SA_5253 [Olavius algarvensis associated proteobacterium Delta 3]
MPFRIQTPEPTFFRNIFMATAIKNPRHFRTGGIFVFE